jgi:mannitol-1-/sugar-/sorbitol-6-phosphatase
VSSVDLGFAAGALTTAAWLPQLYRTFKVRSATEISWSYLSVFGGGVALWIAYGVLRHDAALIATNVVTLVLVVGLIGLKFVTACGPTAPSPEPGSPHPEPGSPHPETGHPEIGHPETGHPEIGPSGGDRPIVHALGFLFDLDGVLVDSTAAVERHWREFAASVDIDADGLLRNVHGRRSLDIIREVVANTDLDAARLYKAFEQRDIEDQEGTVALPGARATLLALPARRWGIVTSGSTAVAAARLRAAGLPRPDVMITADEVEAGKPDPAPYVAGARALGVPPGGCVAIEDSPPGILSARAAGCRTLGLLTTHTEEELSAPDLVVAHLDALALRASS